MKFTTNLNLKKPDYTDPVDIQDINSNMDIVDSAIQSKVDNTRVLTDVPLNAKFTDTIVDISGKADKSQVLTDVPLNAKFTDTVTTVNGKTGAIAKSDITALGIPAQDTVYTHPVNHPPSIITQDANNRFVTDTEKTTWNGKSNFSGSYNDLTNKPTIPKVEYVDNLESTEVEKGLSANQGKILNDKIGTLENLNTIDKSSLVSAINEANSKDAGDSIPKGLISMWSGKIIEIPNGWALCNGQNGTPNLTDRFIMGATSETNMNKIGGANEVTLTVKEIPPHAHVNNSAGSHQHGMVMYLHSGGATTRNIPDARRTDGSPYTAYTNSAGDHTHSMSSVGGGKSHENRPAFYTLAFIMKL